MAEQKNPDEPSGMRNLTAGLQKMGELVGDGKGVDEARSNPDGGVLRVH